MKAVDQGCKEAEPHLEKLKKQETLLCMQRDAGNGDTETQYRLAQRYQFGTGMIKDVKQAIYWCKKADEQGCEDVQPH